MLYILETGCQWRSQLSSDQWRTLARLPKDPLAACDWICRGEIADLALIANPLCDRLDVPGLQVAPAAARLRARNTTPPPAPVATGLGATVLPALVCRDALAQVVFRTLVEPELIRSIDMLWRAGDTPSLAAAAFIRFTTEWVAGSAARALKNRTSLAPL